MSRPAGIGIGINSPPALTREQKRIKVLRALRLRRQGVTWKVIVRRCGNTEVKVLRRWAAMLGIAWPKRDLRRAEDRAAVAASSVVVPVAAGGEGVPAWQQEFAGFYWHQMPGYNVEDQKLNFALFRRGLLEVDEVTVDLGEGEVVLATNARQITQQVGRKVFIMPAQEESLVGLQRRAAMSRRVVEGGAA